MTTVRAKYNSTPPTVADQQWTDLQVDANGNLKTVGPSGSSSTAIQGPAADDAAVVGNPVMISGKYESTLNTVETGDVSTLKTDENGRLLVTNILPAGTSRSGSIATGGTAQDLAAANTSRRSLTGQNISTGDLWINENGGTAAADSTDAYKVPAGATFSVNTNEKVSIVGATTGQKFTATET